MVIVQCVVNGFSVPAEPHELGILEDPELVAHRGLAQLHRVRDVLHTEFIVVQGIQDLDAGGVAEHPEQVGQLVQHFVIRHVQLFRLRCGQGIFCFGHLGISLRCGFI